MKVLYLDESGDHDLTIIDSQYPVFVLAGCIINPEHHDKVLTSKLNKFKKDLFGSDRVILHLLDYTRNQMGFEKMVEKSFREKFYDELNKIIKDTEFTLVACIIDKREHLRHYKNAMDPYLLSLEVILERFIMHLIASGEKGVIVAESRGPQLDNQLNLAFLDLKIRGTRFFRPSEIINTIEDFRIKKKGENIPGLQLIDSVITPVGRRYLNKLNYYLDYDSIKGKFRRHSCGKYKGFGLIILPNEAKRATPATQ
ncbi:MAG: DUF3800 domain-containing protein [Candidatus Omnitrophota bacterium]